MLFAGIRRGHKFSPNHIGNDEAIFCLTANHLRSMGHQVNEYTEDECLNGISEHVVFSMARRPQVACVLQEMERQGAKVINSGYGVENCYRSNMTQLLVEGGVPSPQSLIVDTRKPDVAHFLGMEPCWVKRGDFHAIHKEDVSFARNAAEGCAILGEYVRRGIESAVLNKHVVGDLVKFYGVRGTDFFFHFYPEECNHSKFGHEAINGKPEYYPIHLDKLQSMATQAATLLKIHVYGGDAIITSDGSIYLIDMNDWPSFAPCREQAAPIIARRIVEVLF